MPKGKAIISFSVFTGTSRSVAIAVPAGLQVAIDPVSPNGASVPVSNASGGSGGTDGNITTAPLWNIDVPAAAAYRVVARGPSNTGYPDPQLVVGTAFTDRKTLLFAGALLVLLVVIAIVPSLVGLMRRR